MLLATIQETLESIAKAIQSALGVHVTIVDSDLNKLISTNGDLGLIDRGSANAKSLHEKALIFIDTPRLHEACAACGNKHLCQEFAEICAPILYADKAIGVIGLVAYSEIERDYLVQREAGVKRFIEEMSGLIVAKLKENENQSALRQAHEELDLLFDNLQRGLVYCDMSGVVIRYNALAERMLNLSIVSHLPKQLLQGNLKERIFNQSFTWFDAPIKRGIYDRFCVSFGEKKGLVFFVESLGEAIQRYQALDGYESDYTFDRIDGNSLAIKGAIDVAIKASRTASTVLIQGESGTGKEVFARAIHQASTRSAKAFIAINCGAIPENLLESELFGYEAGAFTGAHKNGKLGKFELADGGTLFLDEIGEMPLNLQVKLLRVLQDRRVERVGGQGAIPIDVRIICATHRDLEKMVQEGEFREDLFYRIQVLPLIIPPLRERTEDIALIMQSLLNDKKTKLGIHRDVLVSDAVYSAFIQHRWPGNIRELENVIEYALNIDSDGSIDLEDLPNRFFVSSGRRVSDRRFQSIQTQEKEMILACLSQYGRDQQGLKKVCSTLGISRATLYRKIKKYELDLE